MVAFLAGDLQVQAKRDTHGIRQGGGWGKSEAVPQPRRYRSA
jgi:hypothetical protein